MKNYWKVDSISLLSASYFYVDCESYLADQLFIQNKVKVRFMEEMGRDDSKYRIIFCKVRKKDKEHFEEAITKLKDKMLLMGYTDYIDECDEVNQMIELRGNKDEQVCIS